MSQSDADCDDGGGDGNCTPWAQIVYLAPGPPSSESPSEARLHVEGNPMLVVALLAAVASLQPHAVRWSSLRPGLAAAAAATMPLIARADKGGLANRGTGKVAIFPRWGERKRGGRGLGAERPRAAPEERRCAGGA